MRRNKAGLIMAGCGAFFISILFSLYVLMVPVFADESSQVQGIMDQMTLEEKISQMIIPAIRTWDDIGVTDLSEAPEIAEALRKHQYGGVILFGSNIEGVDQTVRLIQDLQANNQENADVSAHIPYFMPVDEEGGIVLRLSYGTRMTGNMAIGATDGQAVYNARQTGRILGEELAAVGFNVDFAPVIDVNNNPANPVIGTRSFSDDPEFVTQLGTAYADGLAQSNIIATYKHFPGHGDTDTDSHIGTPTVEKTYEQIRKTELVPFAGAIQDGAEIIMTAHITYPLIDEEVTFGDGETTGFFPATMSPKMITDILRGDLGYEGLVVTDALEMDAISTAGLVEGEQDSAEYNVNIAEKVICAGVDVLLLPMDITDEDAVEFYDDYIAGIEAKVKDGVIPVERIDESVTRILSLKEKYGFLTYPDTEMDPDEAVEYAQQTVGSADHHTTELEMARQAVTLLKNDDGAIPVSGETGKIMILNRNEEDGITAAYALQVLEEEGLIDPEMQIDMDFYLDPSSEENQLHYTEELRARIKEADVVIGFSRTWGLDALAEDSPQYQGIRQAMDDVHEAGGTFVLISENLPYDAARYQDADAILLAYMGSGLDVDPTERDGSSGNMGAVNANVLAAIKAVFGATDTEGKLPVNIPVIESGEDGELAYGSEILYERGSGMSISVDLYQKAE